jgi:hypothetical protein
MEKKNKEYRLKNYFICHDVRLLRALLMEHGNPMQANGYICPACGNFIYAGDKLYVNPDNGKIYHIACP